MFILVVLDEGQEERYTSLTMTWEGATERRDQINKGGAALAMIEWWEEAANVQKGMYLMIWNVDYPCEVLDVWGDPTVLPGDPRMTLLDVNVSREGDEPVIFHMRVKANQPMLLSTHKLPQ